MTMSRPATTADRTGAFGFWHASMGGPPVPRAPLPGPLEVDVAIVGAGFTGLWTALYLKQARPDLEIVVLEANFAGFGASGRNGGWLMGKCEGRADRYAKRGGEAGVRALREQMRATPDEVVRVAEAEGIDIDLSRSGNLEVAIGDAQARRLEGWLDAGWADPDDVVLDAAELGERLRIEGARRAVFRPYMYRIHPLKLVRGLAEAVERLGVTIYESTPVGRIRPRTAETERGNVRANWIVQATEGYTASLRGERRLLAPVNSSMIMTEPLPDWFWDEVGWQGSELIGDCANRYFYMQRTADNRVTIGGRGVPYRFGSATDFGGEIAPRTVAELHDKLLGMFPAIAGARIVHGWSGVLGVPRDWLVSVNADPRSGIAWAGGYSGEGVAATNLAGRILRDLLLSKDTELTRLPWVRRKTPRWEPEPLRFAAIRGVYAGYGIADRIEERSGRPSLLARGLDLVAGR